jgi:hypothetical protein
MDYLGLSKFQTFEFYYAKEKPILQSQTNFLKAKPILQERTRFCVLSVDFAIPGYFLANPYLFIGEFAVFCIYVRIRQYQ